MTAKSVLYAAIGAPVVAARRVAEAVSELRSTLNKEADSLGKTTNKRVAEWSDEGEKLVSRITDAKMVDELTSKVDFDQVSTQVSKLRDQLEDMLATWKASFRPDRLPTVTAEASPAGVKLEAKTAAARTSPAKKSAARKSPAKKSPAKKSPTKKSTAKKAVAKTSGARKAVAKKAPAKSSGKKAPARKAASSTTAAKKANSTVRKSVAIAS